MKKIEEELRKELCMISEMENKVNERLKNVPKGYLRIAQKNGKVQYYYTNYESDDIRERNNNGRYIRKSEYEFAKKMIQRDYDMQLANVLRKRRKGIERFMKVYGETSLGNMYDSLSICRKEMIEPLIISDEEYVHRWLEVKYQGKSFDEETANIITNRGERVRSKSEKIIADKLYAMGIPYRYEYPIILNNGMRVYPDFTLLKMPERKEVYLEHFGLLDEEIYLESTMRKLHSYEENGIFLGVNLLVTYETSRYPLSTKMLDGVLRSMFC